MLRVFAVAALFAGACAAVQPEPQSPQGQEAIPTKRRTTTSFVPLSSARPMPAPVLGRFEQPRPQPVAVRAPERQMITEPPGPPMPRAGETPLARAPFVVPPAALPLAQLPDEVQLQMLERGKAAFAHCFKKAIAEDPTELSLKVKLHVELDENGAIVRSSTNASSRTLDACLVKMSAWMKFPSAGKPVAVELPLFYQGD